jgi:serine protease Do
VVKGGDTVLVPIVQGSSAAQLESAQIRSVSNRTGPVGATGWAVSLDRPLNVLGAPLLNARNEILGIVEDQPSVDMSADQKISMTVLSISRVLRSADRIIKTGGDIQSGWLGVMVDSEAESKGGVAISGVEIDGPAHKAGVLPGDIITRWNGKGIHDYDQLIEIIQNTPIGAKATIGVSRNGQPVQLTAVIEARRPVDPYEMTMSSIASLAAGPSGGARGAPIEAVLGIYVLPLTPELAEILKMRAQGGLFVYSVTPQSAFESAGIAVGDVIIDIDGVRVDSPQTFSDQLRMKAAAGRFALRILRRGSEITRSVVLPGFPRKRSN